MASHIQEACQRVRAFLNATEAWQEWTRVVIAINKSVHGVAILKGWGIYEFQLFDGNGVAYSFDGSECDRSIVIADSFWGLNRDGTSFDGLVVNSLHIIDSESDTVSTIAMLAHVLGHRGWFGD